MTSRSEGDCRRDDVLGINRRNLECVTVRNPRRNFRNADDKIVAKEILAKADLPTPETVDVIERRDRIEGSLERIRATHGCAVMKRVTAWMSSQSTLPQLPRIASQCAWP